MPNVIEIPETVEEKHVEHSYETLPPMQAPRRGFVSKITVLLWELAPSLRERSRSEIPGVRKGEMPLDILAREHPYLYIKAMAG